ncbi:hypothetical protein [Rubinisphaera margarita]|uniref:hypothetical protein n=1 Tax=Rubinisphaera margarita TaxID=2909586 RepID=UPI001EE791B9|nr:hypothetical protein [Rubinisphaera margarita]MCG6158096.1 hypothetical protein [Rubinisphaera margarita]
MAEFPQTTWRDGRQIYLPVAEQQAVGHGPFEGLSDATSIATTPGPPRSIVNDQLLVTSSPGSELPGHPAVATE